MRFEGKTAAVTGAAQGIGRAIAKRLYDEGAKVALLDISDEKVKEAAKQIDKEGVRAVGFGCNVADQASVNSVMEEVEKQLGPVDILINNAGITRDGMFHKMSTEQWNQVIDVNLNGIFNCTRAVITGMRQRKYGKIVWKYGTDQLRSFQGCGNWIYKMPCQGVGPRRNYGQRHSSKLHQYGDAAGCAGGRNAEIHCSDPIQAPGNAGGAGGCRGILKQ